MHTCNYQAEEFSIKDIYTDLDEAMEELSRRRSCLDCLSEIEPELHLPNQISEHFQTPSLVLFRQVLSPLNETLRILDHAKKHNLKCVVFELKNDKFVSAGNTYKRGLGKLSIYEGKNKFNEDIFHQKTIVDFPNEEGKKLSEVKTVSGENLMNFHHDFFNAITTTNNQELVVIDISDWIDHIGKKAENFYETFFKLFLFHSVLAEIFLTEGHEGDLTKSVISPGLKHLHDNNYPKPLIWNYLPAGEQTRKFWDCYPESANEFLIKKGYIK